MQPTPSSTLAGPPIAIERETLDIVMPVYNEAATLADTVHAIAAATGPLVPFRFVIAEDPGQDHTTDVVTALATAWPMVVTRATARRGYARAMCDALAASTAPYVLCVDSDGQYDPADIPRLWSERHHADIVSGLRQSRAEGALRRVGSRGFGLAVRLLFGVTTADPSSSFVLLRRSAVERVLPFLGSMPEAFWWDVSIRAMQHGLRVWEVPIHHHARAAGTTQVFRIGQLPFVAWRQVRGLLAIRFEAGR